ncbi:MAG: DUF362 domain-containing protein, partial [Syntrophomonadaceae bacterium]|nr:DUF362 domain-containing protein [Syntrophomonadaceae bacterium]
MAARVYWTDLRAKGNRSLLDKMQRLAEEAGVMDVVAPGDLVAIKLHFGEPGNMAYIRPPFVRRVVEMVRARGGLPFLTDANTLYRGQRANAVQHLESAVANGFDYAVVGAPLVIADGLTGKDYVKVKIPGVHFREVHIASAAVHADAMVV